MKESDFKFISPGQIRTRFAPSPTGLLHIGGARTALFNYLFAKKHEGSFILRIEDTDKKRSLLQFEKDIMESLKWLGIEWSEGPDIGGKYGPYRQSQRAAIYKEYFDKLIKNNKAYYCFCSLEELEAQRQYAASVGESWRYDGKCSNLPSSKVKEYLREKKQFVIRFKNPGGKIEFLDEVRGRLEFDASLIGDFTIGKGKGIGSQNISPLYNFAVVVDDYEMKISHIIRGEDHLSNTPKQILLQNFFNIPQPRYAHLPLILGPDRSKLSKRHGAVAISEFRKKGYLSEAMVNFMSFLGWNPGGDREIYTMNSLIKDFSLEKIQKGGAIFNIKKLDFLNAFYIRQKSVSKLANLCSEYLPQDLKIPSDYLEKIVAIYQTRFRTLSDIVELTDFFFKEKLDYQKELLFWKKMTQQEVKNVLQRLQEILSKIKVSDWNEKNLEKVLLKEAQEGGGKGVIFWPLRVALTGKKVSAGPIEIASVLGKEKTLLRIQDALRKVA